VRSSGTSYLKASVPAETTLPEKSKNIRDISVFREGKNQRDFDIDAFLSSAVKPSKIMEFKKNVVIFSSGDPAKNVMFLEKGLVKLTVTSKRGKTVVLTILEAGNFFGVWCLAGQARRTATVTTMAPTTVRVISKEQMLQLFRANRGFAEYFISFLLKRNMRIAQQMIDSMFDGREKRLIRALLFLAQFGVTNGDDVLLSKVPQTTLAEMIGSTRTHVNSFMTKLKRMGLVDYNKGLLRIHRTPLISLL